ncbi:hypothetical protein D3C74_200660 [compost metagenome]
MSKKVVLTGNGLSVALSTSFSLPNITRHFFSKLEPEHKAFIEHHMGASYSQLDFEESIASIEQAYDSLVNYYKFLTNNREGARFSEAYSLDSSSLDNHLKAIREIIYEYTASILELIDGHVHHSEIEENLSGFVRWLNAIVHAGTEVDFFTLNFDLLLETILLEQVGTDIFMDFHHRGKRWDLLKSGFQYYFNPDISRQIAGNRDIRLHHLHGSLSSFKDLTSGRLFKITTESLRENNVYDKIFDLDIAPSIVTGGGKSIKVQQSPFNFYYNEFKKKMYIEDQLCDELFIIGYSFRDDHINKAIIERLKLARKTENAYPLKVIIVDYANSEEGKRAFISHINEALELGPRTKGRFVENDERIIFGGANSIEKLI